MQKNILFIADLHLNDQQPEIYKRFLKFLNHKARYARALYILGDLFEYYLGDDALNDVAKSVSKDLALLNSKHNVKCFFMAGNRDFLVSNQFAELSQIEILDDPTLIEIEGRKVILTHADELCTDDHEYQKIRKQLRSTQWQHWFLNLSISERIEFAKQARIKSQEHTQNMESEIMDVNLSAVENLFKQYKCTHMIHGHTHRPAFHQTLIKQTPHNRMVLGDWHHQTSYIEYKNSHFQLVTY